MDVLTWIVLGGVAMAAISLVGALTLVLKPDTQQKLLLPLVAFAAGSLMGGAFFHMIPAALAAGLSAFGAGVAVVAGFTLFLMLEQGLHWHHCQQAETDHRRPLAWLILIGDSLHNFLGGLAIAGTFVVDIRLGITTWLAAAAHEIPQELGDFGVLVHGGMTKKQALLFNALSSLTFLIGGLVTYSLSSQLDTSWLIPFAAGNFLYIGAADLVPEVNRHADLRTNLVHLGAFLLGIVLLLFAKLMIPH
jgi:zinc and cadmium transporter